MIYLAIIAGIFGLDLWIKHKIEQDFDEHDIRFICKDKIKLRKLHNRGAMLHLGEKKPKLVQYISGGIIACVSVFYVFLLFKKGHRLMKAGISFVLGGALSNFYDRTIRGYVVDYFSFQTKWKQLRKIVFNVSDMFIFLGAVMTAISDIIKD